MLRNYKCLLFRLSPFTLPTSVKERQVVVGGLPCYFNKTGIIIHLHLGHYKRINTFKIHIYIRGRKKKGSDLEIL